MRRFAVIMLVFIFFGCIHNGSFSVSNEEKEKEYSATAITLSDFSMKIMAHYHLLSVPNDFDTKQFFALLETIYPDQTRVSFVKSNYKVFVRPLDGGYSVMLCDPKTDWKIMEDLSCHLDRVEIMPWKSNVHTPCIFESNWNPYCE
jgi:hypothetical protein